MATERFVAAPALASLKVFQRRTVDYVFTACTVRRIQQSTS